MAKLLLCGRAIDYAKFKLGPEPAGAFDMETRYFPTTNGQECGNYKKKSHAAVNRQVEGLNPSRRWSVRDAAR